MWHTTLLLETAYKPLPIGFGPYVRFMEGNPRDGNTGGGGMIENNALWEKLGLFIFNPRSSLPKMLSMHIDLKVSSNIRNWKRANNVTLHF